MEAAGTGSSSPAAASASSVYHNLLERIATFIRQQSTIAPLFSSLQVQLFVVKPYHSFLIAMASLTLLFLFMVSVVILATSSSGNSNSNKDPIKNNNKSNNNNNDNKGGATSAAQAFSTLVQTRLQQSKQRALAKQKDLVRLFESKLRDPASSSWWEDLSPSPFRLLLPEEQDALFFGEEGEQANGDEQAALLNNTADEQSDEAASDDDVNSCTVTHFCFLVHGHRGLSHDLAYVRHVMRRAAPQHNFVVHSVTCNEKKTDDGVEAGGERLVNEMLETIRREMKKRSKGVDEDPALKDITISILGNSLGGLYSRYALSRLKDKCMESCKNPTTRNVTAQASSTGFYVLDDAFALYLNIFCTTATPHLGIAGHTFLPLPRRAEIGVAHAMGATGKDLFRLNSLLWEMATGDHFLEPLRAFRKRIAYANAFGTDFPVPAATAAFLSEASAYPHHVVETKRENSGLASDENQKQTPATSKNLTKQTSESSESSSESTSDSVRATSGQSTSIENPLVVATLHTRAVHECEDAKGYYDSTNLEMHKQRRKENAALEEDDSNGGKREDTDDDFDSDDNIMLAQMSTSLDSLGWKKVFVDMRKGVPKISIPKTIPKVLRRRSGNSGFFSSSPAGESSHIFEGATVEENYASPAPSDAGTDDRAAEQPNVEPIHNLKPKGVVSSKEVAASVLTTALPDDELAFHWPMGHNMIVAFSRSRWSTNMYKAGRPVVDALARELVDDIYAFEKPTVGSKQPAEGAAIPQMQQGV